MDADASLGERLKSQMLDYETVIDIDTGSTVGYYTVGHVDKQRFAATILEDEGEEISIEDIRHGFMMKTMLEIDDVDYAKYYRSCFRDDPKEGWTPVTFWGDV